jgi:hypothetical protein
MNLPLIGASNHGLRQQICLGEAAFVVGHGVQVVLNTSALGFKLKRCHIIWLND